jgi:hypothetical protein
MGGICNVMDMFIVAKSHGILDFLCYKFGTC